MAKVITDWVKTAEAIKEGKNLVVKKIFLKDGTSKEIYATNATQSDWVYEGPYDDDMEYNQDLEPELIENEADAALEMNNRMNLVLKEWNDNSDAEGWYDQGDGELGSWYNDRQNYLDRYTGAALESDIYAFLGTMRTSAKSDNWHTTSYLKGMGKLAEYEYVKDFTIALRDKLGGIPFRVIKRMFQLPGRMYSWKDLKTQKGMSKELKGKIRAFKALHKGNSRVIEKGLKAIKNNKPIPNGLSERDIRKLVIIMVANSRKKGHK